MANIDWGVLGLGALIGVGCRKQLKSAGRIAATTAASLAGAAAMAVAQVAKETQETQSPEAEAAQQRIDQINQKIDQVVAGTPLGQNQNPNG